MIGMKHANYCTLCKDKNISNLHKHYKYTLKSGEVVQKYICRGCSNERFKKWYKDNPTRFKNIVKKSMDKYPEKNTARNLLGYAIKKNLIQKPTTCEMCKKESSRIEGHHTDYQKPLVVVWLCPICHSKEHKNVL